MIDEARTEKAVEFIRDNAGLMGQLRGQKAFLEHAIKVSRAQAFMDSAGTVAERDHQAYLSEGVGLRLQELRDCVTELSTVETKIKAAELTIEVWRTQAANQRRGNI